LPQAWIAPAHVREWRTKTRLRKTLIDECTCWLQRIQATLFHHGIVNVPDQLLRANGRAFLRTLFIASIAIDAQRFQHTRQRHGCIVHEQPAGTARQSRRY
jgi:hypothetical protein